MGKNYMARRARLFAESKYGLGRVATKPFCATVSRAVSAAAAAASPAPHLTLDVVTFLVLFPKLHPQIAFQKKPCKCFYGFHFFGPVKAGHNWTRGNTYKIILHLWCNWKRNKRYNNKRYLPLNVPLNTLRGWIK